MAAHTRNTHRKESAVKESILRTLVPIIYALLIKAGAGQWLGLDNAMIESAAVLVASGLVYVALRLAESKRAELGWLLGYPAAPTYDKD